MSVFDDQYTKIKNQKGFVAALDQSGGSTPKALKMYGVDEDQYTNEAEMFDMVHAMRCRIMTNPSFDGDRILGAILFEMTMDREVEGLPTPTYLWERKNVVPFLKIDKGLADEEGGVQMMKPNPGLASLLTKAKAKGIFGTKMRSAIKRANPEGVAQVVAQQFEVGAQIIEAGLVPIIEPEVDIHNTDKAACEDLLLASLMKHLDQLEAHQNIMLKLTLPEVPNFYAPCIAHPRVLKVVALSGGYSREESNQRLAQNEGMVASFSRALTEGLSADQSEEAFTSMIDASIQSICEASAS